MQRKIITAKVLKKLAYRKFMSDILDDKIPEDFEDQLKTIYELEYKYNKLKHSTPEIAKHIEHKTKEIGSDLADKLIEVYEDWLSKHAILKPHEWAEERFESTKELGSDATEELAQEYKRYSDQQFWTWKTFQNISLESLPHYTEWLEVLVTDLNDTKEEDAEEYT